MRHPILIMSTLVVSTLTAAEEESPHQLRLTVQTLPTEVEVETSALGGTLSDEYDAECGARLSLGYWHGAAREGVALLLGGGLDVGGFEFEERGVSTEFTQFGAFIDLCAAWRPLPRLQVEAAVRAGAGMVHTDTTADIEVDDTAYWEVSARLRAVVDLVGGLHLLAEAGYLHHEFNLDYTALGTAIDQTVTASGPFAGIGLGWRF